MFRAIQITALALIVALLVGSGVSRAESGYSFATTPGRLPKTVVPAHYAIDLKPDLTTLAVSGSEVVEIKVLEPTDRLVLNAVDMVLQSASLDGEAGQMAAIALLPKAQLEPRLKPLSSQSHLDCEPLPPSRKSLPASCSNSRWAMD